MPEWFEDEALWRDLYSHIFPASRIAAATEEVQQILHLVGPRGTGSFAERSVLDLCCGPGRHSVALATKGLDVTGVDRTPYLLDRARELAEASSVEVEWVQEDIRRFERPEAFDLALNLFSSFGYFDDPEDDLRAVEAIHRNLRPGGVLVMDLMAKEILARVFRATDVHDLEGGGMLVERRTLADGWRRIHTQWLVIEGDRVRRFDFHLNLYSGAELAQLLSRAGFESVELFGGYGGGPYDQTATRLVVVARKP